MALSKSILSGCLLTTALITLGGCSWLGLSEDKETHLEGDRVSVLELQKSLEPTDVSLKAEGFVAPLAWTNEYWTGAGGYPNHNMQNLSLSAEPLKKIWSADIGTGGSDDLPLTAQPVIYEGHVYTLDANSNVSAFDATNGKKIWTNTVRPKKEDEEVIGGGIAITAGMILVTNGYSELIALNPDKGGIFWRTDLTAPSRAAPTIVGNMAYVLTLDNRITAFNIKDGKQIWRYEGLPESASLISAASPAANEHMVIAPMSSGEVVALTADTGKVIWSDSLSPSLQTGGGSALPDIAGLPVIDKNSVIAVSYGGKTVNLDTEVGGRIWSRDIGGAKSPWVSGNMIFFITNDAALVALGRDTGALAWVKQLSEYDSSKKSRNPLVWQGPIMAENRLILTSGDSQLIEISPKDGSLIRKMDLGDTVAVPPSLSNETLYLLGKDGTLSAYK